MKDEVPPAEPGPGNALEGMLVISIEQAVAAPYCGLLLADAGARVIKIERPEGDFARHYDSMAEGHSAYFVWLNAGKESICLDIDAPGDRQILLSMLRRADVFLHNLAPGALDRRGFDGESLRQHNPGLVTCEITGYGRTGPYAEAKAYDMLLQAETGLCGVTGTAEGPARVGFSVCDIATGLTAHAAILRALLLRGRTGRGTSISVSMFDVLTDWMNVPLLMQAHQGRAPQRLGVDHANLCPYGAYRVRGGEEVMLAVQSQPEWIRFCEVILARPDLAGDPRFATNPDRLKNRQALREIIEADFADRAKTRLLGDLTAARIACGSLNSLPEVWAHPQLGRRVVQVGEAGPEVELAALPLKGALAGHARVPELNADSAAIRREFGAGVVKEERSDADL